MNLQNKEKIDIYSLKHDASLHRVWRDCDFLGETDKYFICGILAGSPVLEASGRIWYTREDSIVFLFKEKYFNIVVINTPKGIEYYCNLASPTTLSNEGFSYMDYDLDIKVFADKTIKILDEEEFEISKQAYNYPKEVVIIIKKALDELLSMIKMKAFPFNDGENEGLFKQYYDLAGGKT